MGWSFGFESKESMVRDAINPFGERFEVIDHELAGDHLWTLNRIRPGQGTELRPEGSIYIRLHVFEQEDGEWGRKSIVEAEGPNYTDCPERLLARSTDMSDYAVAWRASCRR